jgi:hypothetical protein
MNNTNLFKHALMVACLALISLALAVAGASAAKKPKPVGYLYAQCSSKVNCSWTGSTNVSQKKISLSDPKLCYTGQLGLSNAGQLKVKSSGKFKFSKSLSVMGQFRAETVKVVVSGKLKKGKSAKGTVKITTTSDDCTSDTGKTQHFRMKYKGPFYGG